MSQERNIFLERKRPAVSVAGSKVSDVALASAPSSTPAGTLDTTARVDGCRKVPSRPKQTSSRWSSGQHCGPGPAGRPGQLHSLQGRGKTSKKPVSPCAPSR